MILCIAEKPSAGRDIAMVLGATQRREGYMEGNGYCVTWTFGHLCQLKEPADYSSYWKAWSLSRLPMIPDRFGIKLMEEPGIQAQFKTIKSLVAQAEMVVNCGDAGQEGELIQRWVLQLAECKVPVQRLWLSSMTTEAIAEAFQKLRPSTEYENLYHAGLARAIGDWVLGINATRLYTIKYRSRSDGGVLSVGRVQTPTLALIVERYEEIKNFVPEPYWEIKTLYRETTFATTKGRYAKIEEAETVLAKVKEAELHVTDVQKKKGSEGPPRLFDLTSLQVEANKKFGYSADDTLQLIQSLYEKRLVTYPRVDTTYLTNDIYERCPTILQALSYQLPDVVRPLLGKKLPKPKKVFDDKKVTDHHAIIPTGEPPMGLGAYEINIYDLIRRRFIAAFYPNMQYEQTTVLAEVEGIEFKATGRVVVDEGWRVVFAGEEDRDEGEKKGEMPPFEVGEKGSHVPELLEKQTQPPRNYTEATLLTAMETAGKLVDDEDLREAMKQKGIGRPSTRAAIIQTLLKRKYIQKDRKSLIPTDLGIKLIHTIQNELLKSVQLTGEWEYKLRLIDKGEYKAEDFLAELKTMVHELVHEVMKN